MNARSIGFLLVTAAGLSGCSPEPPKAKLTVDEYLARPEVMEAKLEECANNPGDLRNDPDCLNVEAAAARKGIGSLRDLPPLGLLPPKKDDDPAPAQPKLTPNNKE